MYYPLSQIVSNLYTNGNQFVYANTRLPYIGYYWKNSKGQHFTGKTPQDTPTEELLDNILEDYIEKPVVLSLKGRLSLVWDLLLNKKIFISKY